MNKRNYLLLILLLLLFSVKGKAQIKNLIVEMYYVSDDSDATDLDGAGGMPGLNLPAYSKTYRVFVDLEPGSRLNAIYGDTLHTLKFSSTADFFNNRDRGESFGKDINNTKLNHNTVALDTWLTIGMATKIHAGVLKTEDPDSSIVGGIYNDGGSAGVAGGLLVNNNSIAGITLTVKDGLMVDTVTLGQWSSGGFTNTAGVDTTMFGQDSVRSGFQSNSAILQQVSGVVCPLTTSNKVLVAQLTTLGEISFELNLIVTDASGNLIHFVADGNDTTYTPPGQPTIVEKFSPYLKYPQSCGCRDPHYLEFNKAYACDNQDDCKHLIVYGCMDPMACNYDINANYNIQTLCCYPGYCNDRDLATVCPILNTQRMRAAGSRLYPDPVQNELTIEIPQGEEAAIQFSIIDCYGNYIVQENLGAISNSVSTKVDTNGLPAGLYLLRLYIGSSVYIKKFVKK